MVEDQRTLPEQYPLSLNALRLACNQTTNRDPVVDYDEPTIRAALERLSRKEWVRLASGAGSRAIKYRHLLEETLDLVPSQLAVLAVLMLRGPQTPGELKARTERLYPFRSLDDIHATLEALVQRELVARLPRRAGHKEERYAQLLGGTDFAGSAAPEAPDALGDRSARVDAEAPDARVEALEARVARLEDEVASLRRALDRGAALAD